MKPRNYFKQIFSSAWCALFSCLVVTGCSSSTNTSAKQNQVVVNQGMPAQQLDPNYQQSEVFSPPEPPTSSTAVPAVVKQPPATYKKDDDSEELSIPDFETPTPLDKIEPSVPKKY
jgi:hypothetical protein